MQENPIRSGISDRRHDKRGKLRSVRALWGIDSKVSVNKALWRFAERIVNGESLGIADEVTVTG